MLQPNRIGQTSMPPFLALLRVIMFSLILISPAVFSQARISEIRTRISEIRTPNVSSEDALALAKQSAKEKLGISSRVTGFPLILIALEWTTLAKLRPPLEYGQIHALDDNYSWFATFAYNRKQLDSLRGSDNSSAVPSGPFDNAYIVRINDDGTIGSFIATN